MSKIKGLSALLKKFVGQSETQGSAVSKIFEAVPDDQLRGNRGMVRQRVKEEFEKAGPKAATRKPQTAKLERKSSETQSRETDTPQTAALVRQRDALAAKPKRDGDPTKTPEEAGRSAARIAGGMRTKEQAGMQGAYNRLKAELQWFKENDPASTYIAGIRGEMRRLNQRADIDMKQEVEAKLPAVMSADNKAKKADEVLDADYEKFMAALNKRKKPLNKSRGGGITKKKMGAMDYRKGGMVYSTTMKKRGK